MDGLTSVFVGDVRSNDLLHDAQQRERFENMVANVKCLTRHSKKKCFVFVSVNVISHLG